MLKKTLFAILIICSSLIVVYADFEDAVQKINEEIYNEFKVKDYYLKKSNGKLLSESSYNVYNMLVYGKPHGDTKIVNDTSLHRFLGYTDQNESVPTPSFPEDNLSEKDFSDMHWYEDPWTWDEIRATPGFENLEKSPFDSKEIRLKLKETFLFSMDADFSHITTDDGQVVDKFDLEKAKAIPWEDYYHIILPPTDTTYGMAVLFHHTKNEHGKKQVWYVRVSLKPKRMQSQGRAIVSHHASDGSDLSGYDYERSLEDGRLYTFKAPEILGFLYKGYHLSHDGPSPRLSATEQQLSFTYRYDMALRLYYISYHYDKTHLTLEEEALDGDIVLSDDVFDVTHGIPTGEDLTIAATVSAPVKMAYSTLPKSGVKNYAVTVTKPYVLTWTTGGGTRYHSKPCKDTNGDGIKDHCPGHKKSRITHNKKGTFNKTYQLQRRYQYTVIDQLYYFVMAPLKIDNHKLTYFDPLLLSLEKDSDFIVPKLHINQYEAHLKAPTLSGGHYNASENCYQLTLPSETFNGQTVPSFDFYNLANSRLSEVGVRNDHVQLGEMILSDGAWHDKSAPAPQRAPTFGPVTLKRQSHKLSHKIKNGASDTKGVLRYIANTRIRFNKEIAPITLKGNPLTVHTPVVNATTIEDNTAFDQRPTQRALPRAFPLDKVIRYEFKTVGKHLDLPGYGTQDYRRYAKFKRIYFPFDVYYGYDYEDVYNYKKGRAHYLKAKTFQVVPFDIDTLYIKIPYWVDEGHYNIFTQVVSLNTGKTGGIENYANLSTDNSIAVHHEKVAVTGRLFDMFISDVLDPRWQAMFEQDKTICFRSGQYNKNGRPAYVSKLAGGHYPYTLPVRAGDNTSRGFETAGIKLGYPIHFNILSMGNYFKANDALVLNMTFYRIDEMGKRTPVDVYYRKDKQYIKVGSAKDDIMKEHNFDYKMALSEAKGIQLDDYLATKTVLEAMGCDHYGDDTATFSVHHFRYPYLVGRAGRVALQSHQRVFVGSTMHLPEGVAPWRAKAGMQAWYGMYALPNSTIVVKKDADFASAYKENREIVYKDGLLAVQITIKLYKDYQHGKTADLTYVTEHSNEWQLEGYREAGATVAGDWLYYNINQRASDDLIVK